MGGVVAAESPLEKHQAAAEAKGHILGIWKSMRGESYNRCFFAGCGAEIIVNDMEDRARGPALTKRCTFYRGDDDVVPRESPDDPQDESQTCDISCDSDVPPSLDALLEGALAPRPPRLRGQVHYDSAPPEVDALLLKGTPVVEVAVTLNIGLEAARRRQRGLMESGRLTKCRCGKAIAHRGRCPR